MGRSKSRRDEVPQQAARVQHVAVLSVVAIVPATFLTSPLDPFAGPKLGVVVLGAVVCVVAGALRAWRGSDVTLPVSPAVGAATVFIVALGVRGLMSGDILRSLLGAHGRWSGILLYAACAALLIVVLRRFDERSVGAIGVAVVIAAVPVLLYRALQALDAAPFDFTGSGGAPSTLGNPNFLAAFLGMVVPLALWCATERSRTTGWRVAAGLVLVGSLVALLVTRSVQGPVVAAVGILVFGLAWVRTRTGRARTVGHAVWAGALIVGVLGALALATLGGPVERFRDAELWTVGERISFWQAATGTFADDPVVGVGIGDFSDAFTAHRPADHATTRSSVHTTAAHNVPLGFFAEGGLLVGLPFVAFLALVAVALVRGLLSATGDRLLAIGAIGGAWLGWLAQLLISIDTPDLTALGWVLAGAVLLLTAAPREVVVSLGVRRTPTLPRIGLVGAAAAVCIVAVGALLQGARADVAAGEAQRLAFGGEVDAGIERFEEAVRIRPEEPAYPYSLGLILRATEQPEAAVTAFTSAADLHPGDARYARAAAEAAQTAGDQAAVERWSTRLVEIDPLNPEALSASAKAQIAAGRPEVALPLLERAVELKPDAPTWAAMGEAKLATGDEAGGRTALERALELDADNAAAKEALART